MVVNSFKSCLSSVMTIVLFGCRATMFREAWDLRCGDWTASWKIVIVVGEDNCHCCRGG